MTTGTNSESYADKPWKNLNDSAFVHHCNRPEYDFQL